MKKKDLIERIDLKSITNPNMVKSLPKSGLSFLCDDIRKEIIDATSKWGGHLSSNLGDVELTVALCRQFDFSKDKIIFDVGHQCYAYKLLTGRSLDHLNQKGFTAGFQKRAESPYDCYEAGHSSTSISAAEGFALARDLKGENHDVIAFIGDSSIANGLAFEALNHIGQIRTKVIVVLNDNEMSITKPVGGLGEFFRKISTDRAYAKMKADYKKLSHKGKIGRALYKFGQWFKQKIKTHLVQSTLFDNMGFDYIGPVDGHDISDIEKAIKRAKIATKPVIIHCLTTKGKGYSLAEGDLTGYWHGVSPFNVETGEPLKKHPGQMSWSHYFGDLVYDVLENKENVHVITPATLKGSSLENCFKDFPSKCHDVGIAEEHAATLSGALSLNGIHPILSIYSTFLQRAYDEISHDCARMNVNMTILIDRAGLVGSNGDTHQGIYDVAYLKSIPNVTVAMPSDKATAKALLNMSLDDHGVFAIRYPRELVSIDEKVEPLSLSFGKFIWSHRTKTKKMALIVVGPRFNKVKSIVEEENIDCELINPIFLNSINEEDLNCLLDFESIVIYDAYSTYEGFAQSLLSALSAIGYKGNAKAFALKNMFIGQSSVAEQEEEAGIGFDDVLNFVRTSLK